MGHLEVLEPERRLTRVLMRWKRASVTAVARASGVPQSNLSRLLGTSSSPGMGSAKLQAVLHVLGWSVIGPASGLVQRWTLDSEADVLWMFADVLRAKAQIAIVVEGAETLDFLDHAGILLCFWGSSRIVIDAAKAQEALIDTLLMRSDLVHRRKPVVVDSESGFRRLLAGEVATVELDQIIAAERDGPRYPAAIVARLWDLYKMVGPVDLEMLIHDVQTMKARVAPESYAKNLAADMLEQRFVDSPANAVRPSEVVAAMHAWAASKTAADAQEPYQLPWV